MPGSGDGAELADKARRARASANQQSAPVESAEQKEARMRKATRDQLQGDLDVGRKFGESLVPTGSLGEVDIGSLDFQFDPSRSGDVKDIIERRRAALDGMSSQEQMTRRDLAVQQINRQTETARRQLAAIQGSTGLRGGTASAQQADVVREGIAARATFEKDLFLANEQMKRDALTAFEGSVVGAERREFEKQAANLEIEKFNIEKQAEEDKFNLQKRADERLAQLSASLGVAQILSSERTARMASEANARAAQAAACFDPSTKVNVYGELKPLSKVVIGDVIDGKIVYAISVAAAPKDDMYNLNGVIVSGSHKVMYLGVPVKVKDHKEAKKIAYENDYVINIGLAGHKFTSNGMTFLDNDEIDYIQFPEAWDEKVAAMHTKR